MLTDDMGENRVAKTIRENPDSTPQEILDAFFVFLLNHPEVAPNSVELQVFITPYLPA